MDILNKKIYFAGPSITSQDIEFVTDAVSNDWYDNMHDHLDGLIKQLKLYTGAKYVLPTMCCTHALHLSCIAIGLKSGDEVIVTDHSWVSTAHAITYTGATCVFVDIEQSTLCIDPIAIERAITSKTKAIMLVHNFGIPAKMIEILEIARKYNLKIIEDAAPALGSFYRGIHVGTLGDVGCISFQGGKIAVCNQGGAFITNNQQYYKTACLYSEMGRTNNPYNFWSQVVGYTYQLGNLQAALAWSQTKRIQQLVLLKRKIHNLYCREFDTDDRFKMIIQNVDDRANYAYSACFIKQNSKMNAIQIVEQLKLKNIHCRSGFPQMSQFPMYNSRYENKIAQRFMFYGIVLPAALNMTEEDVKYVCDTIKSLI